MVCRGSLIIEQAGGVPHITIPRYEWFKDRVMLTFVTHTHTYTHVHRHTMSILLF